MIDLTGIYLSLPVILLVMARAGGIMIAAPVLSSVTIPAQVRVAFAALLTLVMYPFAAQFAGPLPGAVIGHVPLMLSELGVGLILGFAAAIIIAGIEPTGEIAAQQIGLSLGTMASPDRDDEETSQFSVFFGIFGLLLFLAADGHHWIIQAVGTSFRGVPIGTAQIRPEAFNIISGEFTRLFIYAVRATAPLLAIMFLVNVILGFMAKSVPQMNILMVGYPVKVLVGVLCMALTFPLMLPVARDAFGSLQRDLTMLVKAF